MARDMVEIIMVKLKTMKNHIWHKNTTPTPYTF